MMKKYIAMAVMTLALGGAVLAGCGEDIGKDSAKKIALEDAGVSESDANRMRVSKEHDDGMKKYEVEFDVENVEYNYEIKASDGQILSSDIDKNQSGLNQTQQSQAQTGADNQEAATDTNQNTNTNTQAQTPSVAVSEGDAKKAALEKVPGAVESDLRMELDLDDGQYTYEGDIIYEGKEYEFEIDANTGNFLKWSEEHVGLD